MSSFSSKLLRATLILPTSTFGSGTNTLTLTNLRMSALIQGAAGFPNSLDITIYGMRQDDMNAVTILYSAAQPTAVQARALIQLEASPDGTTWTQVFEGTFTQAQPNYQAIPDACLVAQAFTGNGMQLAIAPPTSYPGATSVAQIAQYLAGQMGFAFENNGVTSTLLNPYFPGTLMDQFRSLCEHANLDFYFDGNATLAICPKGQARKKPVAPILNATSGLIGYPTVQQYGIHVDALFQPAFTLGGPFQITGSDVPGANGTWAPYQITHTLDSINPDGPWFSSMDCVPS